MKKGDHFFSTHPEVLLDPYPPMYFPAGSTFKEQFPLLQTHYEQFLYHDWVDRPKFALDGKSPREVIGDPNYRIALAGSVYTLDAFCECHEIVLDIPRLLGILQVSPLEPIVPSDETDVNCFSGFQMQRIVLEELNEEQLLHAHFNIQVIGQTQPLERVLKLLLANPSALKNMKEAGLYFDLAKNSLRRLDLEGAYSWLSACEARIKETDLPFADLCEFYIKLLEIRLSMDRDDVAIPSLADHLWNYFGSKVPQVQEVVCEMLTNYDLPLPSNRIMIPTDESQGTVSQSGLWTPEDAGTTSGQKLWLPPGQSD